MASPSNPTFRDLQWLLHAIESETLILQNISFHLSQPTSCCHQETENSININISNDDSSFFSHLVTVLGTSRNTQLSLQNLELHNVDWDVEMVLNLGVLLEGCLRVKQLTFARNEFSPECLSEFCDVLKRNGVIKEIIFAESRIGSMGATFLADALRANDTLEELQVWEDSIGTKGAEELSRMIEMNSTLKVLTIFDSSSITATPLISAVLARNRAMEVHVWSGENGGKSSKVVEFAPESSTLRIYRLDLSGSCRVACALGLNSTVTSLDMTGVQLKSRWAKEFRWALEQNQSLKEVNLSKTRLKDKGVVYVAAGLFKNKTLQTLNLDGNWFSATGVEHLLTPLSRFSTLQNQANTTLKSITFGGPKTRIGRNGIAAITHMLTTNQSVTQMGIHDDESLRPDDFVKIFKSLEKNATLRRLSLQGCKGIRGEFLLETIMETLQVNPWIEDMDLARTPLHGSGKSDVIYKKLGQNGRSEPELDLLKDMALTVPKSCRVFFCGQEYAGKNTLCNSILQNFCSSKLPYIDQIKTLVNPVEQAVKSNGMKIRIFKDEDTKISIWNLAGQHQFYSLHDLMFPGHGSASFFLIISSLYRKPSNREPKTPAEIEEDLHYWLRFIVSNSRRAIQQCMLPSVTIVLTHHDKIINQQSQNLQDATIDSILRLRDKFKGFVDLYPTVFTIDARSSTSVTKLTHHLRKTSKTVLQRVPQIYQLCNDMIQILSDWRSENYNKPAMKWTEFSNLCQAKVPTLRIRSRNDNKHRIETRRRAVATCLHHIGEVIYFDELGFLILDCDWFCSEVLAQLIRLDSRRQGSMEKNGFVSKKELEKILKGSLQSQIPGMSSKVFENLEVADLVRMMLKLELCYEQDPSDHDSLLLIPSILEEGRGKQQRWQFSTPDCVYAGRHLECDDSSHTFLTPGFFPRLQVHLHNRIMGLKNQQAATYNLEKYLIAITINGINLRVELGGQLGYYIDVLACSTQNLTETLRLINNLIIQPIQSLCHGVTLTESVIRPECVRNLTPPRYRKTQNVSLQQLKQALLSVPAESMYDYQHTWQSLTDSGRVVLTSGFDFARDLLSDDDFREVLHRRYHDLHNLALELQVPSEDDRDGQGNETQAELQQVDPSFGGIARGVEEVLKRLKIIEQEIRDLKQEIQGMRYYEHRLLVELHRKVDYLVNFNTQLEERRVPKMLYFVRTENYSRKLVTNMVSGMTALRLHMLCEYRGEMHVIEDQIGCEMMQVDNKAVKSLAPYMTKFMKLVTFALKIGAHLAAGMGELIPDLSRAVSHLSDSSAIYGAAGAVAAGAVGAAALGNMARTRQGSRDIQQQDMRAAEQWVLDFLRERRCSSGKDIAEKFGLWRARYRDNGHIAWICRRHRSIRANEIIEVPI